MPASRVVKSKHQPKGKQFAQEITYHQKAERNGSISFLPVPVPMTQTSPNVSASPSTSRQSTQPPVSHKRVALDVEDSLDSLEQDIGASKKPRKPKKVCSSFLIKFSIIINTI
jgi:hypothetical protein